MQEFNPHHSRTNNPILLSNLVLHFFLFNCLQNSHFAKFIVMQRRVIDHPVYQKSIFDRLALEVHTEFSSRVKGSTNSVEDLEALCAHLASIAESKDYNAFSQLLDFSLFGFVAEKRDIIAGFSNFQSLVKDIQKGSLDDVMDRLLTLNNRVIASLHTITSRNSSFTVISETYDKFYSTQLGLYKFRNIDNDTYAIQEKGWQSYSVTSSNLSFIILNLFRPLISSSVNPDLRMASTVGGGGLIPNDLLLDMGLVLPEECLRSLFSMKATSAGPDSRHKNKRNVGVNHQKPPLLGGPNAEGFQDKFFKGKREYSTLNRCSYEAYFSRLVCLEHITLVLL